MCIAIHRVEKVERKTTAQIRSSTCLCLCTSPIALWLYGKTKINICNTLGVIKPNKRDYKRCNALFILSRILITMELSVWSTYLGWERGVVGEGVVVGWLASHNVCQDKRSQMVLVSLFLD